MGVGLSDPSGHISNLGISRCGPLRHSMNRKCFLFCSGGSLGCHSLGDAFLLPWTKGLFCVFPPTLLILKVMNKIRQDKARVILIVPVSLRQAWYSYLFHLSASPAIWFPVIPHLPFQDTDQLLHSNLSVLCPRSFAGIEGSRGTSVIKQ